MVSNRPYTKEEVAKIKAMQSEGNEKMVALGKALQNANSKGEQRSRKIAEIVKQVSEDGDTDDSDDDPEPEDSDDAPDKPGLAWEKCPECDYRRVRRSPGRKIGRADFLVSHCPRCKQEVPFVQTADNS